jgi:hypothetical protein
MSEGEGASSQGNQQSHDDKFAAAKTKSTEQVKVDESLYKPFNVGDIKKLTSTPNHQVINTNIIFRVKLKLLYSHPQKKTQSKVDTLQCCSQLLHKLVLCTVCMKT